MLPVWYQLRPIRAAPPSQFWTATEDKPISMREGSFPEVPGHSRCSSAIHACTAVPFYTSRRSTWIPASGFPRFRHTTTPPLLRTLVLSTGPYQGNCSSSLGLASMSHHVPIPALPPDSLASGATYSFTVCSSSSGPRGVPYIAWIGSRVC